MQINNWAQAHKNSFVVFIIVLMIPNIAMAAGGNPIENGVDWVMTLEPV